MLMFNMSHIVYGIYEIIIHIGDIVHDLCCYNVFVFRYETNRLLSIQHVSYFGLFLINLF